MSEERTALYRLYDADGCLLYVGITKDPRLRWAKHASYQPWWHEVARKRVEWHGSRRAALAAEKWVTAIEKPRYDQSARAAGGQYRIPKVDLGDHEGGRRVIESVTQRIESGEYSPGKALRPHAIAKENGVASITAMVALRDLVDKGLLHRESHRLYRVIGERTAPSLAPRSTMPAERDRIEVAIQSAPDDISEALDVPPGSHVMKITKRRRGQDGRPLSITIEYHRLGHVLTYELPTD